MEFKGNAAIYLQIADYFCEKILLKKWVEGERLPSVRETAVEIEVNPNTVMRTYNYLQEKGIIFNKRGIGYFVEENGFEMTQQLKKRKFVQHDLPTVFKTMKLLNLTFEDLTELHQKYWNNGTNLSLN